MASGLLEVWFVAVAISSSLINASRTASSYEDAVLEALIREEEMATATNQTSNSPEAIQDQSLSVDSLQDFTLEDLSSMDTLDEEETDTEDSDLPDLPVFTPDAGKIRFAEDIVPEQRGPGRRDRRTRRSGAGANTNRRGGSGR